MSTPVNLSKRAQRQLKKLVEQATQALHAQRLGDVEQLCVEIEDIQPGNADVANLRALVSLQKGNWEDARKLFEQAIEAEPARSDFHHYLAKLFMNLKRYAEAFEHYQSAIRCDPYSLKIKLDYCSSLIDTGKADEALPMLEEMCKKVSHPAILMGLALALIQLERFEEAMAYLEKVIAKNPSYPTVHFEYALLLMKYGRMDEAEAEFREVISLQPDDVKAYDNLVLIKRFTATDIEAMEALNAKAGLNAEDRIPLSFALANIYEDMGQFDKAFGFYQEGNALVHNQSDYDLDAGLAYLYKRAISYTPEILQHTSDLDDERPIFIVGMPRCGSTLVEQILAAHPDVSSRGEWVAMNLAFSERSDTDKPLTLEEIIAFSPDQWREIGTAYLEKVNQGPPSKRVTDKSLTNYSRLGAIHCALPRAHIVHVRRNPLDNCLAIYRTNFGNRDLDFGSDLSQLGHYYRTYQRIMQHWREVLPEGVMYELDYEQLVANQEEESRKLLAACGLEWNEACLQFNRTRTYVDTASLAQIRRPMYSEAVGRWKHYEKHLQPLIRILGDDAVEPKTSASQDIETP